MSSLAAPLVALSEAHESTLHWPSCSLHQQQRDENITSSSVESWSFKSKRVKVFGRLGTWKCIFVGNKHKTTWLYLNLCQWLKKNNTKIEHSGMAKMSQTPLPRAAGMEESLCKNWSWQKYCIVMSVMSWKDFQSWSKTAAKIHHQEFQDEVSWLIIKLIMYHHLNLDFQIISPNKSHFIHVLGISIASPCGVLCRQDFGFFGHLYSSRNLLC